jgi:hypothetical protein
VTDSVFVRFVAPAVLSVSMSGFAAPQAGAHSAASGWQYPIACCASIDCGEISPAQVRETPSGYEVTLSPAQHLMLVETKIYEVPYNDRRVRDSPDGVYHACISRQFRGPNGTEGGKLNCLFVPPKGM